MLCTSQGPSITLLGDGTLGITKDSENGDRVGGIIASQVSWSYLLM